MSACFNYHLFPTGPESFNNQCFDHASDHFYVLITKIIFYVIPFTLNHISFVLRFLLMELVDRYLNYDVETSSILLTSCHIEIPFLQHRCYSIMINLALNISSYHLC